jgi:hypothetical protein
MPGGRADPSGSARLTAHQEREDPGDATCKQTTAEGHSDRLSAYRRSGEPSKSSPNCSSRGGCFHRWKAAGADRGANMTDRRTAAANSILLGGALSLSFVLSVAGGAPAALGALAGGVAANFAKDALGKAWPRWRERLLGTPPRLTDELYAAVVIGCERAFQDVDELWRRSVGVEVQRENPQLYATCAEALKFVQKEAQRLAGKGFRKDGLARTRALIEKRANAWADFTAELTGLLDGDEADLPGFVLGHLPLQLSLRVAEAIRQDEQAWRSFVQLLLLDIGTSVEGIVEDVKARFDEVLALLKLGANLDEYRLSVRRLAEEFPYQALRYLTDDLSMPPLSAVYVPRRLEISGDRARTCTVEQVLQEREDLVIVGPAGFGKSSVLRHMALLSAQSGDSVPVLVPARALLPKTVSWEKRLSKVAGLPRRVFEQRPGPNGRWLLLVDGLDEVIEPLARADMLSELVQRATGGSGRWRMIVTTRFPEDADTLVRVGFHAVRLAALTPDDRRSFAVLWFRARSKQGKRAGFEQWIARAGLDEQAETPLLMTLAALLFEKNHETEISSRWQLFDRLTGHVVSDEDAERSPEQAAQWLTGLEREFAGMDPVRGKGLARRLYQRRGVLLEYLACWRQKGEPGTLLDAALRYLHGQKLLPQGNPDKLRRIIAGMLVRTGFINAGVTGEEFSPEIIREFLVARSFTEQRLARAPALSLADLARHGSDPAWREVVLLLSEAIASGVRASADVEHQVIDHVVKRMSRARTDRMSALFSFDFFGQLEEEESATRLLAVQAFRDRLPEVAASSRYDESWRRWAIDQLGKAGRYSDLVAIAHQCRDKPELLVACATALMAQRQFEGILADVLAVSKDISVSRTTRIEAARALIKDGHADEATAALMAAGRHTGSSWGGDDPAEISRLLIQLDRTAELRQLAFDEANVRTEDRVGFATALAGATGEDVTGLLRRISEDAPEIRDRLTAAIALGRLGAHDPAAEAMVAMGRTGNVHSFDSDKVARALLDLGRLADLGELARTAAAGLAMRLAAVKALVETHAPDDAPEMLQTLARHDIPGSAAKIADLINKVGGPQLLSAFADNPELDPSVRVGCASLLAEDDRSQASADLLSSLVMLDTTETRERLQAARILIKINRPANAESLVDSVMTSNSARVHEKTQALDLLAQLGRFEKLRQTAEDPLAGSAVRLAAAEALGKDDRQAAVVILSQELSHGPLDWFDFTGGLDRLVSVAGYEALRAIATDRDLGILRRAEAAALLDDQAVSKGIAKEAMAQARHACDDKIKVERAIQALYALERTADLVQLAADHTIDIDLRISALYWAAAHDKTGEQVRQIIENAEHPVIIRLEAAKHADTASARKFYLMIAEDEGQPPEIRSEAVEWLDWKEPAAATLLERLAFDENTDVLIRISAAAGLSGTPKSTAAQRWLQEVSRNPRCDAEIRGQASRAMMFFGPQSKKLGLQQLARIACDTHASLPVRIESIEAISSSNLTADDDVASLSNDIKQLALDQSAPRELRIAAVRTLSFTLFTPGNVAVLRTVAETNQMDSDLRAAVIEGLEHLQDGAVREIRLAARDALSWVNSTTT